MWKQHGLLQQTPQPAYTPHPRVPHQVPGRPEEPPLNKYGVLCRPQGRGISCLPTTEDSIGWREKSFRARMKGVSSRGSNRWMGCSSRGSRRPGVCSFVFSSTWKAEKEKRSSDHFIPCRVAAARARFKPGTKNPRLVFYMGQSTSVVSQDTLEGSWIRSRARSPANTLPHSSLTHCATTNESLPLRAWGLCCSTSFDLPQVPWGREQELWQATSPTTGSTRGPGLKTHRKWGRCS